MFFQRRSRFHASTTRPAPSRGLLALTSRARGDPHQRRLPSVLRSSGVDPLRRSKAVAYRATHSCIGSGPIVPWYGPERPSLCAACDWQGGGIWPATRMGRRPSPDTTAAFATPNMVFDKPEPLRRMRFSRRSRLFSSASSQSSCDTTSVSPPSWFAGQRMRDDPLVQRRHPDPWTLSDLFA